MSNLLEQTYTTRHVVTTRKFLYHYIDTKSGETPPVQTVLLLHGHGDYSFGWRDVIPELCTKGLRCIAPDLLGFGKTSKPVQTEAYRAKFMCQDMVELLVSAGIQNNEKVIVIGHDWGTHLASRLALHYPDRFLSVVLVAAPYMPPFSQPTSLDEFTKIMPNFSYWKFFTSESCPLLLRTNLAQFWKLVICTGKESPVPMSELEGILSKGTADVVPCGRPALWDQYTSDEYTSTYLRGGWEAPMNWYKAFFDNFVDEMPFLEARFAHPMLIIAGENDPAVPMEVVEMSEKLCTQSTMSSLPCGHWVPQEMGAELARVVIQWLHLSGGLKAT